MSLGKKILLLAGNYPPSEMGPISRVSMVEVQQDANTAWFVFGAGGREILRTPYFFRSSLQSDFAYWLWEYLRQAVAEELK